MKETFQWQCGVDSREVRAFYLGTAQLFFNFWVALKHEVLYRFKYPDQRVTGLETLVVCAKLTSKRLRLIDDSRYWSDT